MEHLKPIGFPLETNGKLMVLRVSILKHFRVAVLRNRYYFSAGDGGSGVTLICLNIGTAKTVNFSFGTNEKVMVLGVPVLEHIRYLYIGFSGLVL